MRHCCCSFSSFTLCTAAPTLPLFNQSNKGSPSSHSDISPLSVTAPLSKLPARLWPNRKLQSEYDRLKKAHDRKGLSPLPSPPEMLPVSPQSARDAELIAEAKLLRQHKGRLEARMQILEDHNKQLESQLHRLRQLLEQVPRLRNTHVSQVPP